MPLSPPPRRPSSRKSGVLLWRTSEPRTYMAFAKAINAGDEKKATRLYLSFGVAVILVNKAPPEDKLKVMEESFNEALAPSPLDCPAAGKPFCEMQEKVQKAYTEVLAAAPHDKRLEVQEAVIKKIMRPFNLTINKAYADGDEKKIARLLAAYSKAADAVIAAAPAEKLKVMEQAFAAAAKSEVK